MWYTYFVNIWMPNFRQEAYWWRWIRVVQWKFHVCLFCGEKSKVQRNWLILFISFGFFFSFSNLFLHDSKRNHTYFSNVSFAVRDSEVCHSCLCVFFFFQLNVASRMETITCSFISAVHWSQNLTLKLVFVWHVKTLKYWNVDINKFHFARLLIF